MNDSRKKMLERVRAILSKTLANGCTEGEAMAAFAKAQELMATYDISEGDIAATAEQQEGATVFKTATADPYDIKRWLCVAVGKFTRCKAWNGKNSGYAVGFAGLESDVVFANWLLDTLQEYVLRAMREHQAARRANGLHNPRRIGASFVMGACSRISERLRELAAKAAPAPTGTANALTVSRNALIAQAMASAGINLRKGRTTRRALDHHAYGAGTNAGNAARFDRPVTSGGALRIA